MSQSWIIKQNSIVALQIQNAKLEANNKDNDNARQSWKAKLESSMMCPSLFFLQSLHHSNDNCHLGQLPWSQFLIPSLVPCVMQMHQMVGMPDDDGIGIGSWQSWTP